MNENLEKARTILMETGCTCVIVKDGQAYSSQERGVKPLLQWLGDGMDFTGCSAADKVVGKATAFLYCLLGIREVYAPIMSEAAVSVLLRHGITAVYDTKVDHILNRQKNGYCPMESAVKDIDDDPAAALAAVKETLKKMQS